jgi:hypothetical protein
VGDRVLITSRDKYKHRHGSIRKRRGTLFWYIELDPVPEETTPPMIYKMVGCLHPLPPFSRH